MGYGIMRVDKVKTGVDCGRVLDEMLRQSRGLATEEYLATHFRGSAIDVTRSGENRDFCLGFLRGKPAGEAIRDLCEAYGAKVRKDSVLGLTGLYALSPEVAKTWTKAQLGSYFQDCQRFHEKHYGKVVAVSMHFDEATPHLHIFSVPLTKDRRLSAKELMGNRKAYHERQQAFYSEVCKPRGLEPFKVKDRDCQRDHLSSLDFKLQMRQRELIEQEKRLESVSLDLERVRGEVRKEREDLAQVKSHIRQAEAYITQEPSIEEQVRQARELQELQAKARQLDRIKAQYPDIAIALDTPRSRSYSR